LEFVKSIQACQAERAFAIAFSSVELFAPLPLLPPLTSQHAAAAFLQLVASASPTAALLQHATLNETELAATSVSNLKRLAAMRYGMMLKFSFFSLRPSTYFTPWRI
jgi:hypothetical protein